MGIMRMHMLRPRPQQRMPMRLLTPLLMLLLRQLKLQKKLLLLPAALAVFDAGTQSINLGRSANGRETTYILSARLIHKRKKFTFASYIYYRDIYLCLSLSQIAIWNTM